MADDLTWDEQNRLYQLEAPPLVSVGGDHFGVGAEMLPYDPARYAWSETPPDDGTCRKCYEWRRYPAGQRHFGLCWWRVCDHSCDCAHHADEVWLA